MILFTTGRGTPFGAPAPTLKLATNSQLGRERKAGSTLMPVQSLTARPSMTLQRDLLQLVIEVAGGKQTKAEEKGFREISIFKDGVVL